MSRRWLIFGSFVRSWGCSWLVKEVFQLFVCVCVSVWCLGFHEHTKTEPRRRAARRSLLWNVPCCISFTARRVSSPACPSSRKWFLSEPMCHHSHWQVQTLMLCYVITGRRREYGLGALRFALVAPGRRKVPAVHTFTAWAWLELIRAVRMSQSVSQLYRNTCSPMQSHPKGDLWTT